MVYCELYYFNSMILFGVKITSAYELESGMSKTEDFFTTLINMKENLFGLTKPVGNIGEAVGGWKKNKLYYERIQGILVDTRYLMYHYIGNHTEGKAALGMDRR